MSQHDQHTDPTGIPELHASSKKGVEIGSDTVKAVGGVRRLLLRLLQLVYNLFILITSAWTTPLLRTRIGLVALFVDAPIGFVSLLLISDYYSGIWSRTLLGLWLLTLMGVLGFHMIPAVWRFFRPGVEHIHRMELGQPNRFLRPVWERVLRRWGVTRMRITLLCEPLLLVVVAFVIWRLEIANNEANTGIAVLVLLSAIGVFLQAIDMIVKERWQIQLLKDQEAEQTALAGALMQQPSSATQREADGVAQIPSEKKGARS